MAASAWIDLRSDTVTQPSKEMRKVMANAEVGDAVYGDDPTVNRLQELAAEITGHQSALFVSSGVQSNLIALLTHCQRGDEYIVGQNAHTYKYEGGGAAVLGSIQPQPIDFSEDGSLALDKVNSVIKAKDVHFARTKLLALENTTGGKVVPQGYVQQAIKFCKEHSLKLHMDGARIANAAVQQGSSIHNLVSDLDSVSVCLSKGLGAPVGSVLCGNADFIEQAKHWQKMLGGGMRQAGIIAAAGIYALQNNLGRLAEDHQNASDLASQLANINAVEVESVNTNIVMIKVAEDQVNNLGAFLTKAGIKASVSANMRMVTHLSVSRQDIQHVVQTFGSFFLKHDKSKA